MSLVVHHTQGVSEVATCDNCMTEIDVENETHLRMVKPMELKGQHQEVTQYYCSVECLQEKVDA